MFDIDQFLDDGYDPRKLEVAIENAMIGLMHSKSKESKWLEQQLENMRDECEAVE